MLMINEQSGQLYWKGKELDNTIAEFRFVKILADNAGNFVAYRMLYDVYKNRPGFLAGTGETGFRVNIRSAVKRIKRRFKIIDPSFDAIENFQAYGYSFKKEAIMSRPCICPTCGQRIINLKEVTVPAGKKP